MIKSATTWLKSRIPLGRPQANIPALGPTDLEYPLLWFSEADPWRLSDAVCGTQIFGTTGSGKTSGSGQAIARAFLHAGMGGLVLTAKPDERAMWQRYAAEAGREDDLVIFSPSQPYCFNPISYELQRGGAGAGYTENIVACFTAILEVIERQGNSGGGGGGDGGEKYWQRALRQMLRNAVDLLILSRGTVSIPDLYSLVMSAPDNEQQVHCPDWQANSFCFQCIDAGEAMSKTRAREEDFALAARYWLREYPNLAEKTRSVIVNIFTSMADSFLRSPLRELFSTTTTITPEMTCQGKILVVNLPLKEFNELGQMAQMLIKFAWQRAIERRQVGPDSPFVFLWADESQFFTSSRDLDFQTTARSSRACTVYLTQSISNYHDALGNSHASQAKTSALMGVLQTHIFHANTDVPTNQYAADLIAKGWQVRANFNGGSSGSTGLFGMEGGRQQFSAGGSEMLEYQVQPAEFTTLRKGGRENGLLVDAVLFQGGRVWKATGATYMKLTFSQVS